MSESRRQSLVILSRVAEFLLSLPEEHLSDLERGLARLTLIPADATEPIIPRSPRSASRARSARPAAGRDMSAEIDRLKEIDSRAEARQLLSPLRKDRELRDLAVQLGLSGFSAMTKAELVEAVVEATVGNRLDSQAIRSVQRLPV